jgi:hypothetical protein
VKANHTGSVEIQILKSKISYVIFLDQAFCKESKDASYMVELEANLIPNPCCRNMSMIDPQADIKMFKNPLRLNIV